jgi:hypothetical protein
MSPSPSTVLAYSGRFHAIALLPGAAQGRRTRRHRSWHSRHRGGGTRQLQVLVEAEARKLAPDAFGER